VQLTEDLVYHQGDDRTQNREGRVDVVAPTTGGPWPVVVAFHIHDLSKASMRQIATEIASRGRVVFVPNWGHPDPLWAAANTLTSRYELYTEEARCAVAFATAVATDYGGDPSHVTLFGRFFGGNAALMAGLSNTSPTSACTETGPAPTPQAIVAWDAVPILDAPDWDIPLAEDPETLYAFTPWRHLEESHRFPIYIVTEEDSASYRRAVTPDPTASFLADRHPDIDLVAELVEMGVLDDGALSLRDSLEWAHRTLIDAGYSAHLILLPGTVPNAFTEPSDEIRSLIVDAVVRAATLFDTE
jgi:dienelactone hydrolase